MSNTSIARKYNLHVYGKAADSATISVSVPLMNDDGITWRCQALVEEPSGNRSVDCHGRDSFGSMLSALLWLQNQVAELKLKYGDKISYHHNMALWPRIIFERSQPDTESAD